jgi:AraC family transcriptional regulator, regulatory protein of adaptative response / methylated-DNA-[protein]-cysteine methyltransferase
VQATAFQWKVWKRLQSIPFGETRSYGQVAEELSSPGGARAVARACASNPVALLIPCHRVVGKDGSARGYRWGVRRKRVLLEGERKRADLR